MDRFLFEKFIVKLEDNVWDKACKMQLKDAQYKIQRDEKVWYNYYPQKEQGVQIVLETTKEGDDLNIDNVYFHHSSSSVWTFKVITIIDKEEHVYLVSREDGTGGYIIRLVNTGVLGKEITEGDVITAQVSGFLIQGQISEEDEEKEIEDGVLLPVDLINNKSANSVDAWLLAFKGKIKYANKYNLTLFNEQLPCYYNAVIDTAYGELELFFTNENLPAEMDGFGEGNMIAGKLFLSGDVAIYDYEKQIEATDLK